MSLIGKALALRNASPVPLGDAGGFYKLPGLAMASNQDEALIRAYGLSSTAHANISLLSESVAAQQWRLYRKPAQDGRQRYTTNDQGSDQRVEVIRHQALTVLNNPNPFWTRQLLFELSGIWMESTGKSFWVVEYDSRASFPMGLWPVRPDRMTPVPDPEKYLKGWVYTAPDGREKIPLLPREVVFNRKPDPLDVYGGMGALQSVLTSIDAQKYAAEWNRNFFVNSARPDGVLSADHRIEDDEWEEMTERWRESHRGVGRAHRIAVLEGVTWVPTSTSVKDMDFANLMTVSRDMIREALGMHKVMTGVTDDVNRANAQTGEEVFASWKVTPRLNRWRDVLNSQFLPLFGATSEGIELDYVYPMPQNREQDNAELQAKSQSALWLIQAGYDPHDVAEVVGLPDMATIETKGPINPAGTTPALPAGTDPGEQAAEAAGGGDAAARWLVPFRAPGGLPEGKKDAATKVFEQLTEDYPPNAIAWVHHADWKGPVKVPLDHIEPDMKEMDGADPDHVQDFVKLLQQGKKLKPVILVKTPRSDTLKLPDGHHRYLAYAELDRPPRAFVATVDAEHGPWEVMHRYQKEPSQGGGRGRGDSQNRMRQMAAWNALAGAR